MKNRFATFKRVFERIRIGNWYVMELRILLVDIWKKAGRQVIYDNDLVAFRYQAVS